MKRLLIKDAVEGDILARDVRDGNGKLLYAKNTKLSQEQIDNLHLRRIKYLYVEGVELPANMEYFDTQSLKTLEKEIEDGFREAGEDEIVKETKRVVTRLILERAIRRGEILSKSQLRLIDNLRSLPPAPQMHQQLRLMVDDKRTTSHSIGSIIKSSPETASGFMSLINSSFFGFKNRVGTLESAISMAGIKFSCELALALQICKYFKGVDKTIDELIRKIWTHSIGAAVIGRVIEKQKKLKFREDIFLPIMLHDIGKVLMAVYCPDDFLLVENHRLSEKSEYYELEIKLLGYNHCDAGKIIAERWEIPRIYKSIISKHHTPFEESNYREEVYLANCANFLSHSMYLSGRESSIGMADDNCWEILGLTPDDIEPILIESEKMFEETYLLFLQ